MGSNKLEKVWEGLCCPGSCRHCSEVALSMFHPEPSQPPAFVGFEEVSVGHQGVQQICFIKPEGSSADLLFSHRRMISCSK